MPVNPWTDVEVLLLVQIVHMCWSFGGKKSWGELGKKLKECLQEYSRKSGTNHIKREYVWHVVMSKVTLLGHKGVIPAQSWVLRKRQEGKNA